MSANEQQLQDLAKKKSAIEWFKGLFTEAHLEIKVTAAVTSCNFTIMSKRILPGRKNLHRNVFPIYSFGQETIG